MMKTVTQVSYVGPQLEELDPVSVCIPDQSFTIQQLLERHRDGVLTDVEMIRPGVYYDDMDFDSPDVEKLRDSDLVEKAEFIERHKALKADLEAKAAEEAKKRSAQKAALEAEQERQRSEAKQGDGAGAKPGPSKKQPDQGA